MVDWYILQCGNIRISWKDFRSLPPNQTLNVFPNKHVKLFKFIMSLSLGGKTAIMKHCHTKMLQQNYLPYLAIKVRRLKNSERITS